MNSVVVEETVPDVDSPEYAFSYYKDPANWGVGSLWFLFAYNVLIWPCMWLATWAVSQVPLLEEFAFMNKVLFLGISVLAGISLLCGVVGLFTYRGRGQKLWPAVVGLVGSLVCVGAAFVVWWYPGFAVLN